MSSLAAATTVWEFGSNGRHGMEILGADTTKSSDPSTAQGLRDQGEQGQDPGKEPEWQSTEQQRLQAPSLDNCCYCCYYCNYNNSNSYSWLPLHHCYCHCSGKGTPQGSKSLSQCPCSLRAFTAPKLPADTRAVPLPQVSPCQGPAHSVPKAWHVVIWGTARVGVTAHNSATAREDALLMGQAHVAFQLSSHPRKGYY